MQRPPCGHGYPIWPHGLAVGEIKHDLDSRILIAWIEQAAGLVRKQSFVLADALPGNVTLGNGPAAISKLANDGESLRRNASSPNGDCLFARIRTQGCDFLRHERRNFPAGCFQFLQELGEPAVNRSALQPVRHLLPARAAFTA